MYDICNKISSYVGEFRELPILFIIIIGLFQNKNIAVKDWIEFLYYTKIVCENKTFSI